MAKRTEHLALPYGLCATLIIDDEAPREVKPERDLIRAPHHEKCHCGKCPNKQKAA